MSREHHALRDIAVIGGLGVGAWYLWTKYGAATPAAAAPTLSPTPNTLPVLPASASSSTASATASTVAPIATAPTSTPTFATSTPASAPLLVAAAPLNAPVAAAPLNAPDALVGTTPGGTDVIAVTPATSPSGVTVLPSNFVAVDNPTTGVQAPVQFVAAGTPALIQPSANLPATGDPCAAIGSYGLYKNNPANIGTNVFANMVDGLATAFNWLQQVASGGPMTADRIAAAFVASPYPQGATAAQISAAIASKVGGNFAIDITNPTELCGAVAGLVAAQTGAAAAAAITPACYLAAYNKNFGTAYTAFP